MSEKELYYGEVCWFSSKKGYGFIQWLDNKNMKQDDMFCHFSDVNCEGFRTLYKGQKVSFNVGLNKHGQPKAINITILRN